MVIGYDVNTLAVGSNTSTEGNACPWYPPISNTSPLGMVTAQWSGRPETSVEFNRVKVSVAGSNNSAVLVNVLGLVAPPAIKTLPLTSEVVVNCERAIDKPVVGRFVLELSIGAVAIFAGCARAAVPDTDFRVTCPHFPHVDNTTQPAAAVTVGKW